MSEQSSFFQRPGSGILGTVILLLLWAVPAVAAMHLELPARAARGDAIRVQTSGDGPVLPVTVSWLEREHVMAPERCGSARWQRAAGRRHSCCPCRWTAAPKALF